MLYLLLFNIFMNIFIVFSTEIEASKNESYGSEEYEFDTISSINSSNRYNDSMENETDSFITEMFNTTEFNDVTFETETEPSLKTTTDTKSDSRSISDKTLCTCDLMLNICEVNCCCDEDCSEEDVKVFVECLPQGLPFNNRYCYQDNIFYKNNTVHKGIIYGKDQLFCIIQDNLKDTMNFKDVPSFNSLEEIKSLNLNSEFSWNFSKKIESNISLNADKAGDVLYILQKDSEENEFLPWSLPSHCFTKVCDCTQAVHYLEDMESSCTRIIKDIKKECEMDPAFSVESFSQFCFVANQESDSSLSIMEDNGTIAEGPHSLDDRCVRNDNKLRPYFHDESKECKNIVSSVRYILQHDGANGIKNIDVEFKFTSILPGVKSFLQRFRVEFQWNHNVTDVVARSGNPGYRFGLPVIVGRRQNATGSIDGNDRENHVVQIVKSGLLFAKSGPSGFCDEWQTMRFGENVRSGCLLKEPYSNCGAVQEKIYTILSGSTDDESLASVFGSPNFSNLAEWVEVLHDGKIQFNSQNEKNNVCDLILDVGVNIVYAAVGSFSNPQFKIIGISYKYGSPQPVDLTDSDDKSSGNFIHISIAVNYFDVSEAAVGAFLSKPVLNSKLPHDFFYPFLLSSGSKTICPYLMCFFIVLILALGQ